MEGCKTGKHLFVKKNKDTVSLVHHSIKPDARTMNPQDAPPVDDFVTCRMDHYQTPSQIHASVYAKQADKERSKVTLEEEKVTIVV